MTTELKEFPCQMCGKLGFSMFEDPCEACGGDGVTLESVFSCGCQVAGDEGCDLETCQWRAMYEVEVA